MRVYSELHDFSENQLAVANQRHRLYQPRQAQDKSS